jgi:hypothetical protein
MGLVQRRIIADYQSKQFPKWVEEFKKVVSFEIPIEVKWDTLMSDSYSKPEQYFEWIDKVFFKPLIDVFSSLCSDDMGREAVKTSVKKILIDGTEGSSPGASKFEDGTLFLNHKFHTNVDNVKERTEGWRKMLEAKL